MAKKIETEYLPGEVQYIQEGPGDPSTEVIDLNQLIANYREANPDVSYDEVLRMFWEALDVGVGVDVDVVDAITGPIADAISEHHQNS
jgi:hypothetical protein